MECSSVKESKPSVIIAYVDEAGVLGYSRNLDSSKDSKVGLMCCLAFPLERLGEMREPYRDGFNRFCKAAPIGAKIHITDAFRPGNEAWGAVARNVREEFFKLINCQQIPIIYHARRLKLVRTAHDLGESMKSRARSARRSSVRIPARMSSDRVETQLIKGLTIKLDALATELDRNSVEMHFDEIDKELFNSYQEAIEYLQNMSTKSYEVKGWDEVAKQQVRVSVNIATNAGFELDVKRIGKIEVSGKEDPLVLVADFVANALNHHLAQLSSESKLNVPSSISSWELGGRVWGARDGAIEDVF